MSANLTELEARRLSMFGAPIWNLGDRKAWCCGECGSLIYDQNAHFGWHLKIDNIDQRVVTLTQARDGLSEWEGH